MTKAEGSIRDADKVAELLTKDDDIILNAVLWSSEIVYLEE